MEGLTQAVGQSLVVSTDQLVITGRNRDSYDITIVATSDHLPSDCGWTSWHNTVSECALFFLNMHNDTRPFNDYVDLVLKVRVSLPY